MLIRLDNVCYNLKSSVGEVQTGLSTTDTALLSRIASGEGGSFLWGHTSE